MFPYDWLGFENHLNYIYSRQHPLSEEEVCGLSAFLNSFFIDRYFRITNGTTQVNATELRALPLPPLELVKEIGRTILTTKQTISEPHLDQLVQMVLEKDSYRYLRQCFSRFHGSQIIP